jgi:hypothetical protein
MITTEELNKMDACKGLLPEPGPEVVGKLIDHIREIAPEGCIPVPNGLKCFSQALHELKQGRPMSRSGWNGKNMFVYMVPANSYPAQTGVAKEHFGEDAMVPYGAYFAIKGVDGIVNTWVPSVSDLLADDWGVANLYKEPRGVIFDREKSYTCDGQPVSATPVKRYAYSPVEITTQVGEPLRSNTPIGTA